MTPHHHRDLDDVAAALRNSLGRIVRRLRVERADEALSLFKLIVLASVSRRGPISATELAARERIRPQSLTRLLAFLEKTGLVERRQDETDRRRLLITVTAKGKEALERNARNTEAWLATTMARCLSASEQEVLFCASRLLDRLAEEEAAQDVALHTHL